MFFEMLYTSLILVLCFDFQARGRPTKDAPTKTQKRAQTYKKRQTNKPAKKNVNGRYQIGRSAVADQSETINEVVTSGLTTKCPKWDLSANPAGEINKKTSCQTREEDIFPYKTFLNLNESQSDMLHTLMLKLGERFKLVDNVIINEEADIGLLNKSVRYKKFSKRHGLKARDKYDEWRIFVCISSACAMVQHFFATSTITKLLVNVMNMYHSTGLLIEKVGDSYEFTSHDPNNKRIMTMTQSFCNSLKLGSSETRVVRCVSGKQNNLNDKCFAMSWEAIYKSFTGQKCLKTYQLQFYYDFVAKKKIKLSQ